MWYANHTDDDSVWCYNDEYHCFLQSEIHCICQNIIINLYIYTLVLYKTILVTDNNLSLEKNEAKLIFLLFFLVVRQKHGFSFDDNIWKIFQKTFLF